MSETTGGKLAEALAKAQAEIRDAPRDRQNPFFNSKYATLSSVWEVIRGPLTKNGLSVLQAPSARMVDGRWVASVTTTLMHSSGEERAWTLEAPVPKPDVQGLGSALTYLRRYSLGAVGVASDEDDDGNAASQTDKPATKTKRERQEPPASTPSAATESHPTTFPNFGKARGAPIRDASMADLEFYLNNALKSLDDPKREQYKAANKALADAIGAEIARQKGGTQPPTPAAAPTPKPRAIVDQEDGETEEHAKMRTSGGYYAQAVKVGAQQGWEAAEVGKWLRTNLGRTLPREVTEADVQAFARHFEPPSEPGAGG